MKCIGVYVTKSIRCVITDKDAGKCKYEEMNFTVLL